MRHSRFRTILPLAACILLVGCPLGTASRLQPAAPGVSVESPRLQGHVAFPDRTVAATPTDVARRATVSVIDSNMQTVAATLTDTEGSFSLALGFNPAAGACYIVEAIKPLSASDSGGRVVRMRTLVQWTGNAWTSCTGGAIALTPTTTAVAVIKATQPTLGYPETMGVVANEAVASNHPTLNTHWASVKSLVASLLSRDLDPLGGIVTQGTGYALATERAALFQPSLAQGSNSNTWILLDGSLQLTGSLPRPRVADEVSFAAGGVPTAGLIATDGKFLYMKPWGGSSTWNKIGSGYQATTQGANAGTLVNATSTAYGAGFYNNQIYQALSGGNGTLERIDVTTNAVTTTPVSTPMIFRETGLSNSGSIVYLASDGNYLYNGAYSIGGGGYNGFTVRVYDPLNGFAMVRQLLLDGANTPLANTSYYTDGTFTDGVYYYVLEWNSADNVIGVIKNGMARLRRFRLSDGQLEAETTVGQVFPSDDPITGCYDPVNNKFWFANYQSATIHRTAGRSFPGTGSWVSTPIDLGGTSPLYGRLNFNAVTTQGGEAVRFRVRSANDSNALASATWYGPTGTGDYYTTSGTALNSVHNRNRWAQIQVTLVASTDSVTVANTTPRLYGVSLEAVP